MNAEAVRKVVRNLFASRFAEVNLVDVEVHPGTDSDGDPIFEVTLVIDAELPLLDPKHSVSLVRLMRPELQDAGVWEEGYPMISYLSREEALARSA